MVAETSDVQLPKVISSMILTPLGMGAETSEVQERKAPLPIVFAWDGHRNERAAVSKKTFGDPI